MTLSPIILSQVNFRINQEEISSRLYKSMSVFLENQGFFGAAKLFAKYADEELTHANFAYNYLSSLSILPTLDVIPQPVQGKTFKDLENIIGLALKHEIEIAQQCSKFAKICLDNGDFVTFTLAQKYCSEQIEEIDKASHWVDRLSAFGDSDITLMMIDKEMGEAV